MDRGMRRRLLGLTAALVVMVPLSVVAARWQWNRHIERDALNAAVLHAESTAAVPWRLLQSTTGFVPSTQWRRVTATGRWDASQQLLVRKQTVHGNVGFTVLTPFDTADGARLVVLRGWVPDTVDPTKAAAVPDPPTGDVSVTLRVRMVTGDGPMAPSDLPHGEVNRVDPAQLDATWWGRRERIRAVFELIDPVPAGLVALPWPELTSGPHLSYFVQWILIGLTAVIVYVRVVRSELRGPDEDDASGVGDGVA